jgi:hypothetical protein
VAGEHTLAVAVTAEISEDGSKQHWKLELDADLLRPEHGNAARCRAVPHRPPDAKLTELRRPTPSSSGVSIAAASGRQLVVLVEVLQELLFGGVQVDDEKVVHGVTSRSITAGPST